MDDLNASETEILTLHLLRLRERPLSSTSVQSNFIRFDQVRSVTWLRIVRGVWLLVATSDSDASSISLYRVADILRDSSQVIPAAEAYLPAPVRDGAVDFLEDNSVLIALSLASEYVRNLCIFQDVF